MYIYLIGRSHGWSIIPPKYLCGFNKKEKSIICINCKIMLKILSQKNSTLSLFPKNIWSSKVHFKKCTMHNNANNSSVSIFVLFALLNIIIA